MPTVKIGEIGYNPICTNIEHNPATMRLWEPGVYEHTCPACGHKQRFTIHPKQSQEPIVVPSWVNEHNKNYQL